MRTGRSPKFLILFVQLEWVYKSELLVKDVDMKKFYKFNREFILFLGDIKSEL